MTIVTQPSARGDGRYRPDNDGSYGNNTAYADADDRPPRDGSMADSIAPPRTGWLVWVVLLAALVVDVIAFHNVIVLVLNTEREYGTWSVVVGFALLALWLAHETGERARSRERRNHPALSSLTAWILFTVWLSLGLFAFLVRWTVNSPTTWDFGNIPITIGGQDAPELQALLFLTLYLATGTVAGFTGYKRPHPAVRQYRRVRRARRKCLEYLARVHELQQRLSMLSETLQSLRRDRERQCEESLHRVREVMDRLKLEAELLAAPPPPRGIRRPSME